MGPRDGAGGKGIAREQTWEGEDEGLLVSVWWGLGWGQGTGLVAREQTWEGEDEGLVVSVWWGLGWGQGTGLVARGLLGSKCGRGKMRI